VLRRKDLHRDHDVIDIFLREEARVRGGDSVDEWALGRDRRGSGRGGILNFTDGSAETENSPAAVAETNGDRDFMRFAQLCRTRKDLGFPNLARILRPKRREIDLVESAREERFKGEGLAAEEIGDVDGCVCFAGVVVCEETDVGKGPAEEVVDDEDCEGAVGVVGGARARTGDVGVV
jgi:hypothetical protein